MKSASQPPYLRWSALVLCLGAAVLGLVALTAHRGKRASIQATVAAATRSPVDFNRDIRPIINQNCVTCHGGVRMLGNISFVFREEATRAGESGHITIKPGDAEHSELMARITTRDPEKRMPPVDHGRALEPGQVELFRQWIDEGAPWSEHWAFVAPKPQHVPELGGMVAAGARSPVDHFIIERLAKEGLSLSPQADKAELLRRASLDLTGLPPTPAEMDAFRADGSPDAYERQVDRLLDSPGYGERWAALWMDLARYADTTGFEKDTPRPMWRYRDWLIDALNRNMPYDEFVIEQLAGDLLPNPTLEQLEATAFHRNTPSNDEGGIDAEEFRMLAVQDRAATTWQVFNGVTYNCTQCHSHPYDPIRHEEYYRFLAFFNSSRDANYNTNDYPTVRIPDDPARNGEALKLQNEIESLRGGLVGPGKALEAEPGMWRPLPLAAATAEPGASFELKDGEAFAVGTVNDKARYDLVADVVPGDVTAIRIEVQPLNGAKARHTPEPGFIVTKIEASVVHPSGAEEPVKWDSFWGDSSNLPETRPNDKGATFTKALREKYRALTKEEFKALPGDEQKSANELLSKAERPAAPAYPALAPGGFAANPTLFKARWVVAVPARPLRLESGDRLKVRLFHGEDINTRPAVVRRVRVLAAADPRWTQLAQQTEAQGKWAQINGDEDQLLAIPGMQLPIMRELPVDDRRDTLVFHRGNFMDKEGEALQPDVPAIFPPFPKDSPRNRLTLARWMVAPGQPLTARVAANRYWEQLFGIGIVETLEDFGSVGQPPSHPELLDWLALHFQDDLHWNVKALLRELVTSATYRQRARATPQLLAKDPRNRLLSRGPHNRLTAEMVRDNALVAGGLLSAKMHGASVMPPQPAGVWSIVYDGGDVWVNAQGEDRYRRALYTYWRRTSPYPSFLTFDTPMRDLCTVRRIPTNTPLQALVTLNDPVYVEAAQAIARRMQAEGGATLREQVAFGFRLGATRGPTDAELKPLLALYDDSLKLYRADADELKASGLGNESLAALTAVASAMLNLDVTLTK